jgi:hypothetical protein
MNTDTPSIMHSQDIFIKHKTESFDFMPIEYNKVISSIPKDATDKPNIDLFKQGYREWRWRFLKFNEKKTVEISYRDNDDKEKRFYLNKSKKWINKEISLKYDKFVQITYYYYSLNS